MRKILSLASLCAALLMFNINPAYAQNVIVSGGMGAQADSDLGTAVDGSGVYFDVDTKVFEYLRIAYTVDLNTSGWSGKQGQFDTWTMAFGPRLRFDIDDRTQVFTQIQFAPRNELEQRGFQVGFGFDFYFAEQTAFRTALNYGRVGNEGMATSVYTGVSFAL